MKLPSFGAIKNDLIEYGTAGAAGVGANMAWEYLWAKAGPSLPTSIPPWAKHVLALVAAGFAAKYVGKYNKNAGMGAAVGLAISGVRGLAKQFAPTIDLGGIGEDFYPGMNSYLNGAPTTIEQVSGAPTTIEELNGISETAVAGHSFAGYRSSLAATLS